jgi:hypothetical protein
MGLAVCDSSGVQVLPGHPLFRLCRDYPAEPEKQGIQAEPGYQNTQILSVFICVYLRLKQFCRSPYCRAEARAPKIKIRQDYDRVHSQNMTPDRRV